MGSALRAVELMIANDDETSQELAQIIERENSLRQQIDSQTFEEACEIIEKNIEIWKKLIASLSLPIIGIRELSVSLLPN